MHSLRFFWRLLTSLDQNWSIIHFTFGLYIFSRNMIFGLLAPKLIKTTILLRKLKRSLWSPAIFYYKVSKMPLGTELQLTTHQWIQTTPYLCNERIFGSLLFTFNKIFLKNPLQRFVALTFALLLAPFESKLFNN